MEDIPEYTAFEQSLDDAMFRDIEMPVETRIQEPLDEVKRTEGIAKTRELPTNSSISRVNLNSFMRAAAILFIGLLGGYLFHDIQVRSDGLSKLSVEVSEMKYQLMFALIEKPVAHERLKAVRMTSELESVGQQVAWMLLQTLKYDDNVNVRLAALDALSRYTHLPHVRKGLIQSIPVQDSPIVQLRLAEMMNAMQNTEALGPLKSWLNEQRVPGNYKADFNQRIESLSASHREI